LRGVVNRFLRCLVKLVWHRRFSCICDGSSIGFTTTTRILETLYSLLLKGSMGFNELKRVLGVNSRSLSLKLKELVEQGYIEREVKPGPPLRSFYTLTERGKSTALLSLPLVYYIMLTK